MQSLLKGKYVVVSHYQICGPLGWLLMKKDVEGVVYVSDTYEEAKKFYDGVNLMDPAAIAYVTRNDKNEIQITIQAQKSGKWFVFQNEVKTIKEWAKDQYL